MGPLLLLLIQAATPASAKPVRPTPPQSMSILVDPCASATDDNGRDVVVCGRPDAISPRLPLRNDRGPPDHPVPSNPDGTGIGALAATATPCAIHGCYTGFGQPLVEQAFIGIAKGLRDLKDSRARRRDGTRRVTIDLDAPPAPIPTGAVRP